MRSRRNVAPDRFTCLVSDLFIAALGIAAVLFILKAGAEVLRMAMEAL